MQIVENENAVLNKNVLIYDCFDDGQKKIATIHIDFSKNAKAISTENDDNWCEWNVWERIECASIEDYFELKKTKKFRREIEQKIKENTVGKGKMRVKILVFPYSDDCKLKEAMKNDMRNIIYRVNNKNIVIDEYVLQ